MSIIFLNLRQAHLLEGILDVKKPISLKEAAASKQLTACGKTLHSDFAKIRSFAEQEHVQLELSRGIVYVSATQNNLKKLRIKINECYLNSQIAYTQQRSLYIVLDCLLESKIPTLDNWSEHFNISRPRIQENVKQAKQWLKESGITFLSSPGKGYALDCDELVRRKALLRWIFSYFENELPNMFFNKTSISHHGSIWSRIFGHMDFSYLCSVTNEISSQLSVPFAPNAYNTCVTALAIMVRRIQTGHTIRQPKGYYEHQTDPNVTQLCKSLSSHFGTIIPLVECKLFFDEIYLLQNAKRLSNPEDITTASTNKIALSIARSASALLEIPFESNTDFIDEFTFYILDVIQSSEESAAISNQEQAIFSAQYPVEISLGQQFPALVLKELGIKVPQSTSFSIGIFLATHMEKIRFSLKRKKRALLVSTGNARLSMLLYWQIMNLFSSQLEISEIASYHKLLTAPLADDIDMVISTINLANLGVRNIVVSSILSESDIEVLRRNLSTNIHKTKASNSAATAPKEKTFIPFYIANATTSQELFQTVGKYMEENGYAYSGYTEELMQQENTYGSGIETKIPIALPHTTARYTMQESLGVVVTKNPICYRVIGSEKTITSNIALFPLLKYHDVNESFFFLFALSALRNAKTASLLIQCSSKAEISDFIDIYFKKIQEN